MTLIAETHDEAAAFLIERNAGRELFNAILFDCEDVPPEIRQLALRGYGAAKMFDEAQADIRLAKMPPEGRG